VRRLKFDREPAVARYLGPRLAALARSDPLIADADQVTFVPMTQGERHSRGLNPSRRLAAWTAQALGVPMRRLLLKTRSTQRQTGLSARQRQRNVHEAFSAPRWGTGKVLLVDDIYTTGATADACGNALRQAGYREVVFIAAARAHRVRR
jgi:predicted amidophosphoribosyltransferase